MCTQPDGDAKVMVSIRVIVQLRRTGIGAVPLGISMHVIDS